MGSLKNVKAYKIVATLVLFFISLGFTNFSIFLVKIYSYSIFLKLSQSRCSDHNHVIEIF
jgi:hypothetical protein